MTRPIPTPTNNPPKRAESNTSTESLYGKIPSYPMICPNKLTDKENNVMPTIDLKPYFAPNTFIPARNIGIFMASIASPGSSPSVWYRMVAIPLTPPPAIFAGVLNAAIPKPAMREPMAIPIYSVTARRLMIARILSFLSTTYFRIDCAARCGCGFS